MQFLVNTSNFEKAMHGLPCNMTDEIILLQGEELFVVVWDE